MVFRRLDLLELNEESLKFKSSKFYFLKIKEQKVHYRRSNQHKEMCFNLERVKSLV